MQLLSDRTSEMIQGGQRRQKTTLAQPLRQAVRFGLRQMNLAINIIIGSGTISNTQINMLIAESNIL